ncbi:MAG: tellurite resistance/C4-dicarboxylate transporter family protein [Acidimicrobiales bacterium]
MAQDRCPLLNESTTSASAGGGLLAVADGAVGSQLPAGRLARALATLDPGWFAWVMASGIVSIGADLIGYGVLSQVVLGVTVAAFAGLTLAYAARIIWFRGFFRESLRDPTTAMAYFTVAAGTGVVATRVSLAVHPDVTLGLGAGAAVVWLVFSYGLPSSIVASARRPVLGEINGTWLIWVVATQSLSIVAAALTPVAPSAAFRAQLPVVAVCLWGVGVMLYVILIVIIFLRLLLVEVTPAEMGPAYWIAMGATAISVRAAAGILVLHGPHAEALVRQLRPFMVGLSVVLWAFGTWWIPLLVAFGLWRYVAKGYSRAFEPRLWSVVFPLGMYTVASWTLGRAAGFDFMVSIARVWVFVGLVSWAAVLALMGGTFALNLASGRPAK